VPTGAKEITPEELKRLSQGPGKTLITDVRESSAFERETISGAIHIPLDQLKSRLKEIPKGTILAFT
jgi:rhodanese-related sulfurtransferase